jgi:hypothetical protein
MAQALSPANQLILSSNPPAAEASEDLDADYFAILGS